MISNLSSQKNTQRYTIFYKSEIEKFNFYKTKRQKSKKKDPSLEKEKSIM